MSSLPTSTNGHASPRVPFASDSATWPSTLLYDHELLRGRREEARRELARIEAAIKDLESRLAPAFPPGSSTYIFTGGITNPRLIHVAATAESIHVHEIPCTHALDLAFPTAGTEGGAA